MRKKTEYLSTFTSKSDKQDFKNIFCLPYEEYTSQNATMCHSVKKFILCADNYDILSDSLAHDTELAQLLLDNE